jgi:uncharacterized protein (DUF362 family)
MASPLPCSNRREFLKTGLASGAAALFATRLTRAAANAAPAAPAAPAASPAAAAPSKVALTNGDNRTDNIFRAMKSLEKEIAQSIGNRRVVIKPNNVSQDNQLASSHADALAGICEFLKSIGKIENAIIAESAMGNTMGGFQNFGYTKVAEKYNVKLVDLDQEKFQTILAFDQTDVRAHPVRVSSMLANQTDNFIISACMLKTHDRAVATMGIKNIILGAALKLGGNGGRGGPGGPGGPGGGFRGGPGGMNPMGAMAGPGGEGGDRGRMGMGGFGGPGGGMGGPGGMGGMGGGMGGRRGGRGGGFGGSDKGILHGGGSYGISVNLAMLSPLLHPSLTVIDGFQGMEGNGPIGGTPVDHKVCVVSQDYLAADTVGASLMGIDPKDIGYLVYLADAKLGEFDTGKMEIIGESIAKLAKKYQLGSRIESQLQWKQAARVAPATQG